MDLERLSDTTIEELHQLASHFENGHIKLEVDSNEQTITIACTRKLDEGNNFLALSAYEINYGWHGPLERTLSEDSIEVLNQIKIDDTIVLKSNAGDELDYFIDEFQNP